MVPRNEKQQLKRNNRKHWLLACVPLVLAVAGMALFVAIDKQPTQYEGDTFTNVKTTVSSTTTSTSVSSSSTSVEDSDSTTDTNSVYTESSDAEQLTDYTTLWVYASALNGYCDRDGNKINRSGFYILTPVQNHTNYVEVIEVDMRTNDEYHVKVYGEAQEINDINYQSACANAEQFCNWLREQAPDGHTTYGLQSNYDYWVKNCKNKYN